MISTSPNSMITNGVKINVKSTYEPTQSNPNLNYYIHSYHIIITNLNHFAVQLSTRNWIIIDGNNNNNTNSIDTNLSQSQPIPIRPIIVNGTGVIGLQPILQHNEIFEYTSGTEMYHRYGTMEGSYQFIRLNSGRSENDNNNGNNDSSSNNITDITDNNIDSDSESDSDTNIDNNNNSNTSSNSHRFNVNIPVFSCIVDSNIYPHIKHAPVDAA